MNNQIEAPESDYLFTKESQLPNAGNGLFTAIKIYKDEVIALYKGEILNELEAKIRAIEGNDKYFINLIDGTIMDSMHVDCFAKYANDASGYKSSIFRNNTKIALNEKGDVCIIATRLIKNGEELFCSYGKNYWIKHAE